MNGFNVNNSDLVMDIHLKNGASLVGKKMVCSDETMKAGLLSFWGDDGDIYLYPLSEIHFFKVYPSTKKKE
jgi:hypothetical protein